jgi:hypothetical protein
MPIVRKNGKPDLYITIACNPEWPEIKENLKPWQRSEYRPDLIARVFNLKSKELLKDIIERQILGVVVVYIYVIEFQKRDLPHAHIVIFLRDEDKPRTREIVDQLIRAEIPDKDEEGVDRLTYRPFDLPNMNESLVGMTKEKMEKNF